MNRIVVEADASLVARVLRRRALRHSGGGDGSRDLSPHVRAGSGLAWLGGELVIAQDDTSYLAVLSPDAAEAAALPLDHVVAGRRVFEERLGNKRQKLDLEACMRLPDGRVVVVGSGSLPVRERLVVVAPGRPPHIVDASALYAALRARADFAGSELNLEGATVLGGTVVFVNRGNGARIAGREPVDALALCPLDAFLAFLDGGAVPSLGEVRPLALGEVGGVRLTPTDVCARGRQLWMLAAAEASPNTIDDGEVVGTAIVCVELATGRGRLGALLDETGQPLREKVEGLAWARPDGGGTRAYAVVDRDDPDRPAELLELEIQGS